MQTELETRVEPGSRVRLGAATILIIGFSLIYFAQTLIMASEKYFWADEISTFYLTPLSLGALWQALKTGIDSNPPFFYWLTRLGELVAGPTKIGLRLPEIVAFWIFCLCLFRFVRRIAGVVPGFIAMAFPLFTGAYYYAFEGRPSGLVLGFTGLAMVCWQMAEEGRRRGIWLTLFSISLFAAAMTHCYAIVIIFPFAMAELFEMVKARRIAFANWAALVLPVILAVPVYLPLSQAVHRLLAPAGGVPRPNWRAILGFYQFLLSPCLLLLFLALILLCVLRPTTRGLRDKLRGKEFILALGFAVLSPIGFAVGHFIKQPYFDRYFLAAIAGISVLLALVFRSSPMQERNVAGLLFAGTLCLLLVFNLSRITWHRMHGWGELVIEPAAHFPLDTTPHQPLANEHLLLTATGAPIVTRNFWEFLYVSHYSPQLSRNLFFLINSRRETFYRMLREFAIWGSKYNAPIVFDEWVPEQPRFYLYGGPDFMQDLSTLIQKGWQVRLLQTDAAGQNLALVEKPMH